MAFPSTFKVHVASLDTTLAAFQAHCIHVDEVQVIGSDVVIVYDLWASDVDETALLNMIINDARDGDYPPTALLEVPSVADMQAMDNETQEYTQEAA